MLGRMFAVAADLARSEGIADGGYRLVSNVGRGAARRSTTCTSTSWAAAPFEWPPG